jgi:multidrug efflux pump subunit AcrA (membrane-fusion protein)
MSTPTTLSALVAEENKIAEAITNTEKTLRSLSATMPQLEGKFAQERDAYNADTAAGHKALYPAESKGAISACKDEITTLDAALVKLRAEQDAARKATKRAEDKEREAREYADLIELCKALEPALVINNRLKVAHETAGSMHRPLALPWLDQVLLDSLGAYATAGVTPPAPRPLPKTHVLCKFLKSWPGSQMSSSIGATAAYSKGEIAGLPRRTAVSLEAAGVICAAPKN